MVDSAIWMDESGPANLVAFGIIAVVNLQVTHWMRNSNLLLFSCSGA